MTASFVIARPSKRTRWLFVGMALVGGSALALACGARSVDLSLQVPPDVDAETRWYEVGALEGTTCPPREQLAGGVPARAAIRKTFSKGNAPSFGNLSAAKYAFIATARADDCHVIATGCTIADMSEETEVTIPLDRVGNGAACSSSTVCQVGQCVPPTDNGYPTIGAGCTLELVGSGPLPNALGAPQAIDQVVSHPAIAATPNGFLIAYRETVPSALISRLTLFPVDKGAGGGTPQQTVLEHCGPLRDGVGIAFHGDDGLVVAAKPCKVTQNPGFQIFSVDATGATKTNGFSLLQCKNCADDTPISMGRSHTVAWSDPLNAFLFAYVQEGQSQIIVRNGDPLPQKFGSGADLESQLISQGSLLGLLATSKLSTADGGTVPDAGAPNRLAVNLVSATQLSSIAPPSTLVGTWGSSTVLGNRIFVVTDGNDKKLTLRGYEPKVNTPEQLALPVNDSEISESTLGEPVFADITGFDYGTTKRLFIVTQRTGNGGTSLLAIDNASTTPVRIREVPVPGASAAADGRVAVAASDSRVGVVWMSRTDLTSNDRLGGYAIFACR